MSSFLGGLDSDASFMGRALRLIIAFVSVYALILAAFQLTNANVHVARWSAELATTIIGWASGAVIQCELESGQLVFQLDGLAPIPAHVSLVNRHLPLFLAVVIVLANRRRLPFALLVGVGSTVVIVLESVGLAALLWKAAVTVPRNPIYQALQIYAEMGEAGLYAAPTFIGALVALALPGPARKREPVPLQGQETPTPGQGSPQKRSSSKLL